MMDVPVLGTGILAKRRIANAGPAAGELPRSDKWSECHHFVTEIQIMRFV